MLQDVAKETRGDILYVTPRVKFMRTSAGVYRQHLEAPRGAVKKGGCVMNEAGGAAGSEGC